MIVELNGFDESGIIGENLRFIRVGIDTHEELRPLIYNLLHFGSVTMTKRMLKGQGINVQRGYIRAILNDPAIDVSHYAFPPTIQLALLRHFTATEFSRVCDRRRDLIRDFNAPNLKETVSKVINYFKKYLEPWRYIESFIKSYGYRMIVQGLEKTSRILSDKSINDYKVICLVDGGYPFVFWGDTFLRLEEESGYSRFSHANVSIYGITHGDEYYPIVSLAGNIATITNRIPGMIFPQSVKEIPSPVEPLFENYCDEYSKKCLKPKFFPRILFFGWIDPNLQFLVPFIQHRNTGYRIYEPFRVRYRKGGSFKSFYYRYKGFAKNDIVVSGKIIMNEEKEMQKECQNYGLNVISVSDYFDDFVSLLDQITEKARGSNLDKFALRKITGRLNKIEEQVKKSLTS